MPTRSRNERAMGLSFGVAIAGTTAASLLLSAVAGAQQPQREPAPEQRPGVVLQQQVMIIEPGDQPQEVIEDLLVHWEQFDDLDAIRNLDRAALQRLVIRGNIQAGQPNQVVWINDGRMMRRGVGLERFSQIERLQRDELTIDRVIELLGWSGMAAMHADEPLNIADWPIERVLEGLNDPDAATRRRATSALALSSRFDDDRLHDLLGDEGLTLEQRSRLLDVSFARFVVAPRAAVGASFNTGAVIRVTNLFPEFPAAQQNLLRPGDELVEIDGQSLLAPNAFNIVRATVLSRQPGETVPMVIRRPFPPEEVAQIRLEREQARALREAEAQAEAEARFAEARAQAQASADDADEDGEANDPWADDPVWRHILKQMEIITAKNPDARMDVITREGDFIFAGQLLGNIAHLDGVFRGGQGAIAEEPGQPDLSEFEDLLTPGETITVDIPLGSLSALHQAGGAGGPGVADLHSAWRYRLGTLGIDPERVTADTVAVRTPERGWIQTNVGDRVTTLIASPRSARQHEENSDAMNRIRRGAITRGDWNRANVMFADESMPRPGQPIARDSTAFRVQSTELAEPEVRLRRHAALNERIIELAGLRERHATLTRRIQSQPVGGASDSLQRDLAALQQRIDTIEQQLRPDRTR